ncbi:hypothetical protein B30_01380 [Celeribacter baekdonensis B30]|uniref:Uncharacterized protein n=1 Tax=Celeribacter baekdonensis B30 TaxID=1208323 RepID=K2IVD2_9RHOB|nr:hypothetical protein B30_01380 [Celeribacter baekdonensis B30]
MLIICCHIYSAGAYKLSCISGIQSHKLCLACEMDGEIDFLNSHNIMLYAQKFFLMHKMLCWTKLLHKGQSFNVMFLAGALKTSRYFMLCLGRSRAYSMKT